MRAGIVVSPGDYRWSSYRHNAEDEPSSIVKAHNLFLAISPNTDARQHHYRELFRAGTDADEVKKIRNAAAFSMPLGSDRFKRDVETMLGRTVGQSHLGRPERALRL